MTDGVIEQALAVTKGVAEGAAAKERHRIANWLADQALVHQAAGMHQSSGSLSVAASAIRSNQLGPDTTRDGGHGDDR